MTALRTIPLPAIGDTAPPAGASAFAPLWISAALLAGAVLTIGVVLDTKPLFTGAARFDRLAEDLFPKDPARCCDANGDAISAAIIPHGEPR
jgi:hypothetical protein